MNVNLWEAIIFMIELVKLLPIMYFILKFEFKPIKKIGLYSLIILVVFSIFCISGLVKIIYIGPYLCLIYCILILKGKHKTLGTIITYLAISLFDMLISTIFLLFFNYDFNSLSNKPFEHIAVNSISIIIIFIFIGIFKVLNKKNTYNTNNKTNILYLLLFLLGEISLGIFLTVFQSFPSDIENTNNKIMAVSLSMGSIIFLLVGVILFINYISKNHYKNTSEINEKLLESQEKYYTMMLNKDNETIKFRHDIINHINCMYMLFEKKDYDELKNYFDKIGASLLELRPTIQTGNDMVSAILNDVSSKYPNVKLDIDGKLPNKLNINNTDLCTIFSNLFENAFYAANQSDEKIVRISIKLASQNLCFEIMNTIPYKVEIINNEMTTQKDDKINHGYGTINARKCAENNNSSIYFSCTDSYFTTEIVLFNTNI